MTAPILFILSAITTFQIPAFANDSCELMLTSGWRNWYQDRQRLKLIESQIRKDLHPTVGKGWTVLDTEDFFPEAEGHAAHARINQYSGIIFNSSNDRPVTGVVGNFFHEYGKFLELMLMRALGDLTSIALARDAVYVRNRSTLGPEDAPVTLHTDRLHIQATVMWIGTGTLRATGNPPWAFFGENRFSVQEIYGQHPPLSSSDYTAVQRGKTFIFTGTRRSAMFDGIIPPRPHSVPNANEDRLGGLYYFDEARWSDGWAGVTRDSEK